MTDRTTVEYWADWLVDAVATATQNRRFLRGDPAEEEAETEAIYANGKKAMENLLKARADGETVKPTEKQT